MNGFAAFFTAVGYCLVSAYVPIFNSEVFVLAFGFAHDSVPNFVVSLGAALGLTLGEIGYYLVGRGVVPSPREIMRIRAARRAQSRFDAVPTPAHSVALENAGSIRGAGGQRPLGSHAALVGRVPRAASYRRRLRALRRKYGRKMDELQAWSERHSWAPIALTFTGGLVGVPPIILWSAFAGRIKVPVWIFVPFIFVGLLLRFEILFRFPRILMG